MKNLNVNRFFWIIGGGLLQIPLISEVRNLGYSIIISDANLDCVCAKEADVFFHCDIFDIPSHLKYADEFIQNGGDIVAVLAAGIDAPETMAQLANKLKLPGVDPAIAHLVNNKDKFRKRMLELGYPVPKFKVIDNSNFLDLAKIIAEMNFPLIVKNTDSSGSRGTKIFPVPDLPLMSLTIQEAMKASRSNRALIEECWEGPEQTVETIFDINGKFFPCFITDRFFNKHDGFCLETGLRHPSILSIDQQNEMYKLAECVARDLGVTIGAAKFDMMLTKDGPRIIEMTVRLSGGFDCQYLVPAATGKNILLAAVLTSLGKEFPASLLVDTRHLIGVSVSLWPKCGKITAIRGVEEAKRVEGVQHIFFRYDVGDEIKPYIDCTRRVCFIIIVAANEQKIEETLVAVNKLIEIDVK